MSTTGMHAPDRNGPAGTTRGGTGRSGRGRRTCLAAGIVCLACGIACVIWPGHSITAIVRIIALAILVAAGGSVLGGYRSRGRAGSGTLLFSGIVMVLVALFMAWHPGMTGDLIVMGIGGAVLMAGLAAAGLGTVLRSYFGSTRWLQIGGVIGAVVGFVLVVHPHVGATVMGLMLGIIMVLFGTALVAMSLRLAGYARRVRAPHGAPMPGTDDATRTDGDSQNIIIEGDVVD